MVRSQIGPGVPTPGIVLARAVGFRTGFVLVLASALAVGGLAAQATAAEQGSASGVLRSLEINLSPVRPKQGTVFLIRINKGDQPVPSLVTRFAGEQVSFQTGEDGWSWAVAAVPVDAPGITYVLGRQASDGRALEGIDQGNATYAGQEALIVFEDVFVPDELVFMDGEVDWAAELVERFTTYHRRSYVCKTGLGDVLIGAAAQIAEDNGVPKASHIQDKLVEMAHLNETLYGTGIAASHASTPRPAGNWEPDPMLANVCKHNVTRFPFELGRLAQDLAGGLVATGPSDKDLEHPEVGPLLERLLRAAPGVPTKRRLRVLRLIENMTMGRNAVGYLTESLHGAGSPQAQRIQIRRMMDVEGKKALARRLAGVDDRRNTRGDAGAAGIVDDVVEARRPLARVAIGMGPIGGEA